MSKGWYGNSYKHNLASRGISTKDIKDVIQYPEVIDYSNASEIIVGFWSTNISNDYSKFDFDKAFVVLNNQLTDYIRMASEYTEEEVRKVYKDQNGDLLEDLPFGLGSEVLDVIDLKDRIEERERHNLKENIILLDDIIHIEHMSGSILWDNKKSWWIDMDKLREDFDNTLKRMGVNYDKGLVW